MKTAGLIALGLGLTISGTAFAQSSRYEELEVRFCGRYWVYSGHRLLQRICRLLTQSGHRPCLNHDPSRTTCADWYAA